MYQIPSESDFDYTRFTRFMFNLIWYQLLQNWGSFPLFYDMS